MKFTYPRVCLLLSIIFSLLVASSCGDAKSDNAKGRGAKPPVPVEVFVAQPDTLQEEIDLSGTLMPEERVEIQSEITARVVRLAFKEGQKVQKGQLLVELDASELTAERKRLKVELELAQTRLKRQEELLQAEALSQDEYDQTASTVAQLEAENALLSARIARTRILAPFSGVVGVRAISLGAVVSPGTAIATLQQLDPIRLVFELPEKFRSLIKVGQTVNFNLEGENRTRQAQIFLLDPQVDADSRTLRVLAHCPNPGRELFPGTYARVSLTLSYSEKALMVPAISVISELQGTFVYLAKAGKAHKQKVELGYRSPKTVEIKSGLQAGDSVLTTGLLLIAPDSDIRVQSKR